MWDDIQLGWRHWQSQRLRWCFLVLAWGIFSALVVTVAQLGVSLSKDRPSWSESNKPIYTVAYGLQGQLTSAKGTHIDEARELPEATHYSKFVIQNRPILVNGREIKVAILFYDVNFFLMLQSDESLWRSEQVFATSQLKQKISQISKDIVVEIANSSQTLQHWLPQEFNTFSSNQIDLYMPLSQLGDVIPFFKGNNATETQALMNELPLYYGLIEVAENFSVSQARQHVQSRIDEAGDSLVSLNLKTNIEIVKGVELSPLNRSELLRQLVILSIILIAFAFVLISNYFSVIAGLSLKRSREFSLKFALGASFKAQLKHLFFENLAFIVSVLMIAIMSASFIQWQLYSSDIFNKYFAAQWHFSWSLWALVLFGCLSTIFFVSLLPVINLLKGTHFNRAKDGVNKAQRTLANIQLGVQILVTLFALNFALSCGYQELKKQWSDKLSMSVTGYEVNRHDDMPFALSVDLLNGHKDGLTLSDSPLISPRFPQYKISMNNSFGDQVYFTDHIKVAENFFATIDAKFLFQGQLTQNGIVINEALARELSSRENFKGLIGKELRFLDDAISYTIVAVIENLPHSGESLSNIPVVYSAITPTSELYSPLYVYASSPTDSSTILTHLNVSQDWGKAKALGDIKQQLYDLNKNRVGLLIVTLQVAVLIFVMLVIGILYQVKTMLLGEQRVLGLKLAVGKTKGDLLRDEVFKKLAILLISALLFVAISMTSANYFMQLVDLDITVLMPIVSSVLIVLIALLVSSCLALRYLNNSSIKTLLSEQAF